MKRLLLGTLLLAWGLVFPIQTMAGTVINIGISPPPAVRFAAPPQLIVLPETYIYAIPDTDADIFFSNGWWWRQWEGRWYRSNNYNSDWKNYQSVPSFYKEIPSDWRNDYKEHRWRGHQWNIRQVSHQQVQQHWKDWERSGYWEKQQTWGVQDLQPRMRSKQPSGNVQSPQSRPQSKAVKVQRSQKNRNAAKSQKTKQQKGNQKTGKSEKQNKK